jgi:GNAT superfamily N-acetyltransferase
MATQIRIAQTSEDRQRVFRFRYEIYVEEMQRQQKYADHAARTVEEPFDQTGHIFLAEDEMGRVVGTLRTNFGRDTDFGSYRELYGLACTGRWFPQHVSICTKLMVAPEYRSSRLGIRLAGHLYQFGLEHNILFDFIDCNPPLEPLFFGLGYCRYHPRIQHPEYGDVLPLVLPLTDLAHLEEVGSPFARICREHCPLHAANHHLHQTVRRFANEAPDNVQVA